MTRSKQTARRPMGGLASRKPVGVSRSDEEQMERQVAMFKERGTRTIVVEGSAEFAEKPNIIHLSFLIDDTSDTIQEGIQKVGKLIAKVRAKASELNVPNDHVFSDSVSSEMKREEVGYYEDKDQGEEWFKVVETKIYYKVKSVVRIYLHDRCNCRFGNVENKSKKDDSSHSPAEVTFSQLCFYVMTELGLRTYNAPVYELEHLTQLRNQARQDAMADAKQKAVKILEAFQDDTVTLGPPIAVTDTYCSTTDDAEGSFLGNWGSLTTTRITKAKQEMEDSSNDKTKPKKRARTEVSTKEADTKADLDPATAGSIFVVPTFQVSANVRTIFEITVATK